RRFTLKYIEPDAAKSALSMYLPPDRIVADSVNRSLLIKGRDDELQKVEEVLTTIDMALETRVFPLNNNIYEAEEQLARFKELLKIIIFDEARVQYDFLQKTMIVKGTKEELEGVAELIGNLDRKLPQIMIDVKMVEINRNKIKDLGVKWTVGGEQGQISFGEMSLGGSMERSDLVSIQIKALEQKGLGRLVGNPRILTLSGKTATINVGDRVPYRQPVITPDGKVTYELQFMDVGIKLEVTPSITSDGMVIVHAKPNISTFTEREYVLEGLNFKDPQKSEKTADTTARLRNGETLVIGGLIRSEDVENITKIPLLSEIPIIGGLFTLRNKTHKETELIVFLTPYLVEY
ncbi:MAG: hypothetical protein WCP87_01190, partial [Atribacterota bacterium]